MTETIDISIAHTNKGLMVTVKTPTSLIYKPISYEQLKKLESEITTAKLFFLLANPSVTHNQD